MRDAAGQLYEQMLVVRCRAGDDAAFEELVERYHDRLRYYVRRVLGGADGADDVLQDVWLTAFRKLSRLRNPAALRVWLYRIARNRALAELRKRERWTELTEDVAAAEPPGEEPEFSPQDAARIHACLARLRTEHRDVLTLRFLEGMGYEEIAGVVGRPIGTVRSRIHYA